MLCPKCGADLDGYTEAELASGRCPVCRTQALGAGMEGDVTELDSGAESLAERTASELIGKTVGNCEILEVLGSGGMGVVFKAHHIALDKIVALKILPGALASSGGGHIERFLTEARAAARIEHPNIVQVYDINEDKGYYYIIMQYVDGPDLHKLVAERGPLEADLAVTIVQQIATALHEIHKVGVIHRDIKPTNVLITRSGQVKLTDLGLAKFRTGGTDTGVSDANVVLGTPDYMAPEQAMKGGPGVDERSDIYSLGVTFYHLLTGKPPFRGDTAVEILVKHATEPLVSPRMVNPKVPTAVARVVERMMAKKPADRYQSASELLHALRKVEDEMASGKAGAVPYAFSRGSVRQNAWLVTTALQRGLVTPEQVLRAASVQEELVAFGAPRSMSEILVEKGFMGREALEALLDDYRRRELERLNTLFGRVAVTGGIIDRATLKAALERQAEIARSGREALIGKVLMDSGRMNAEQVDAVLRAQSEIQRSADEGFFETEAARRGVPRKHVEDCLKELAAMDPEEDATLVGLLLDAGHIDQAVAQSMVAAQVRQLVESFSSEKAPPETYSARGGAEKAAATVEFDQLMLEEVLECPYCQTELAVGETRCPSCGRLVVPAIEAAQAAAPVSAPSRKAPAAAKAAPQTRPASPAAGAAPPKREAAAAGKHGPWGYLSDDQSTTFGLSHDEMVRLVGEGAITEDTTVRGPGTDEKWVFAGRAPGIAKYLGLCPHCQKPVKGSDQICTNCDRFLDVPDAAADLPRVGEGSVSKLKRWLRR